VVVATGDIVGEVCSSSVRKSGLVCEAKAR